MEQVAIVALFEDVLGTEDILAGDNFFDAGGNSIRALHLIAEIEKRWGVALTLIDVIRAPTPSGVADLIARAQAKGAAVTSEGAAE